MDIPRFQANADSTDIVQGLKDAGCAVVERLVPANVFDAMRAELAPYFDATPFGPDDFSGRRTKRTGGLIARSATCREVVLHPLVLDVVGKVLAHATSFQLHLTQVIAIGPNEPGQPIHRDQWAFDFFPFPPGYEVQCNTLWAMTDFTEENGATRVVPGSNHAADRLEIQYRDTQPAEMPAGSVSDSLYSSRSACK